MPPAAFAACFVSSRGTLIVSKFTERERSVITGLCGVVAGAEDVHGRPAARLMHS